MHRVDVCSHPDRTRTLRPCAGCGAAFFCCAVCPTPVLCPACSTPLPCGHLHADCIEEDAGTAFCAQCLDNAGNTGHRETPVPYKRGAMAMPYADREQQLQYLKDWKHRQRDAWGALQDTPQARRPDPNRREAGGRL